MKLLVCHDGQLQTLPAGLTAPGATSFATGLTAWDALAPGGVFAGRAVHELLFDPAAGHAPPLFPALLLARAVLAGHPAAALVWCDGPGTLYPPALAAEGIPLHRLYIVRAPPAHLAWTIAEGLRCQGVGAVVAALPPRLSRLEARRLQLAAEQGGGVGLLLRPFGKGMGSDVYAAATRWFIRPAPGERTIQRWNIQLLHGHGGRIGPSILLEKHRVAQPNSLVQAQPVEANPVHLSAPLADPPPVPAVARASA